MRTVKEISERLYLRLAEFYSEKGQTLIEYILVIVAITLAIFIAYSAVKFNNTIETTLENLNLKLNAP
jgi:Flp pilus assembly pilin Flp